MIMDSSISITQLAIEEVTKMGLTNTYAEIGQINSNAYKRKTALINTHELGRTLEDEMSPQEKDRFQLLKIGLMLVEPTRIGRLSK